MPTISGGGASAGCGGGERQSKHSHSHTHSLTQKCYLPKENDQHSAQFSQDS